MARLNVDARRLIRDMGYYNIDQIPPQQRRNFQMQYLEEKIKMESAVNDFITERSFIDIATYWVLRDAVDESDAIKNQVVNTCRLLAKSYDLHFFLPFGTIPFDDDGYRSRNMKHHQEVSDQILSYLKNWNLKYISIETGNINDRIGIATEAIKKICSNN